MYQGFYNLKENPFRLTPDPAYLYMTVQHREALAGLVYSCCTRSGLAVLVGEAGTGKTTVLTALLGLLEKRRFVTAVCTNPMLTRQEFFDLLMVKFSVDCSSSLKSRQLVALQQCLERHRSEGRPCVLVVDEAQRLPVELLEEIRLLLNLETTTEKLLHIILAGQPELMDVLRRPELRQLKQRVSCVSKLNPLSIEELKEYLPHRLARAGAVQRNLFSETVMERIYEYSQGIPRLINTLCDAALQNGMALQASHISIAMIDEAAKDLELSVPVALEEFPIGGDSILASLRGGRPVNSRPVGPDSAAASEFVGNGNGAAGDRIATESYANRQGSLRFFSNLMDRWK